MSLTTPAIFDPFGWVKDQVIGGLQWGVEQAAGFVTNLLAGIADALIPDWLADEALNVVAWIVAIPNYAAAGEGAGGFAFGGLNSLRATLTWVGVTLVPLTLTAAIGRSALGLGADHPVAPLTRALSAIALVLLYPLAWGQLAAGVNHLTRAILRIPAVEHGLNEQFEFIVGAGALRGVPMLGALLLLFAAVLLVGLFVVKLMILVGGAVLYVTGVLMPGIAATERGQAVAQAWITATVGLMAIPVLWTVVFAVGALLMADAGTAASTVAGSDKLGKLVGGLMLAVGSIAATAVALKLATAIAGVVLGQVGGALALVGSRGTAAASAAGRNVASGAAAKLGVFGERVGGALRQTAGDHLTARGARAGALGALGAGGLALRGGLIAATKAGGRHAAASALGPRRVAHRAPAGAVAGRLATSVRAGWTNPAAAPRWSPPVTSAKPAASDPPTTTSAPRADTAPARGSSSAAPSRPAHPAQTPPPPPSGVPPVQEAIRPTSAPPAQPAPARTPRDSKKGGSDADVPPSR